jgi:hypothetical protein
VVLAALVQFNVHLQFVAVPVSVLVRGTEESLQSFYCALLCSFTLHLQLHRDERRSFDEFLALFEKKNIEVAIGD